MLRKSQPNFQYYYIKKINAQAKNWFSYKKRVLLKQGLQLSF